MWPRELKLFYIGVVCNSDRSILVFYAINKCHLSTHCVLGWDHTPNVQKYFSAVIYFCLLGIKIYNLLNFHTFMITLMGGVRYELLCRLNTFWS